MSDFPASCSKPALEWGKRPSINPTHSAVNLPQPFKDGPIYDWVAPLKKIHPWNRASHPVLYENVSGCDVPDYLPVPPDMRHMGPDGDDSRHFLTNVLHRTCFPERRGVRVPVHG